MYKISFSTKMIITWAFAVISLSSTAQIQKFDFEENTLNSWTVVGDRATLSSESVRSGRQALELQPGTLVQTQLKLKPLSKYKLSAWLKTSSGSDEIRLNVSGLGEHNTGTASALADWTKIELTFVTGKGQKNALLEIFNPENTDGRKAWADDLAVEYLGDYLPEKIAGIKPPAPRIPKTDLGIAQQPNEKTDWLLDARFGMFIHWGLYSGPGKGEWYMENKGILPEEYRKLAYSESGNEYFAADAFNAGEWAQLAEDAGMKYMSMVTMHHDGYALFSSKATNAFTSEQTHHRDFVKEYVDACHQHGLKVGIYKTLINWRYPGYYDVSGNDCWPNKFGYTTDPSHKENARLMKEELYVQVKELLTNYGKIDLIFWDGGWLGQQGSDADGAYFWESGKFLDPKNEWQVNPCFQDIDEQTGQPLGLMGMVRKYQPDALVNPRSGWYGDFKSEEGGQAITGTVRTEEVWEKCMTMAPGWGYTPAHEDSAKVVGCGKIKRMLADCTMRNMVLLLNVAPDRHGRIPKAEQNVLRQTGQWLKQAGEAIYGAKGGPWNPKDGEYGFAYNNRTIYIFLLDGYKDKDFVIPTLNEGQKVVRAYSVTDNQPVAFQANAVGETVLSNFKQTDKDVTILAVELNKEVMGEAPLPHIPDTVHNNPGETP